MQYHISCFSWQVEDNKSIKRPKNTFQISICLTERIQTNTIFLMNKKVLCSMCSQSQSNTFISTAVRGMTLSIFPPEFFDDCNIGKSFSYGLLCCVLRFAFQVRCLLPRKNSPMMWMPKRSHHNSYNEAQRPEQYKKLCFFFSQMTSKVLKETLYFNITLG